VDVRAIVLLSAVPRRDGERLAASPLALADVLGKSVLSHLVDHLFREDVNAVSVISAVDLPPATRLAPPRDTRLTWTHTRASHLWRVAENAFNDHAQSGADAVLVVRLGAYAEFELEPLLQAHLDGCTPVTRALHADGTPLDVFLVAASRRNEGAYLLRHKLLETRSLCGTWTTGGYWRPLDSVRDLRCLGVDGLLQRNRIRPAGEEVRPGVWVARGARVHRRARVLAPAYIGAGTTLHANAVVTRCGIVERHAEIGSGTVIEDATVLPYTRIGTGLDVARAVVGSRRVMHLERDVEVEIADPRLVGALSPSAAERALGSAAAYLSLPAQLLRALLAAPPRAEAPLPAAMPAPSPALNTTATAAEAAPFPRSWH
jgi:hypothetical protein